MKKIMTVAVSFMLIAITACVNELKPTGDVQKDAESLGGKIIEMLKGVKVFDDFSKINPDLKALQEQFIGFYKEKGNDGDFIKALTDYSKQHASELLGVFSDSKLADAAKGVMKATCAGAFIPSGDAAKDSEGLFNWFVNTTKGVKSVDDMKSLDRLWGELGESYSAFYASKGEQGLDEFKKVSQEYAEAHKAELDAAQAEVSKNIGVEQLVDAVNGVEENIESTAGQIDKAISEAADSIHNKAKKAVNDAVNEAASKAASELTKALGL